MSTTLRTLVLASLLFAAAVPFAGADSVTYVGPNAVSSGCTALVKAPNGADSQTCHAVPAGSTTGSIEIVDVVLGSVAGFYAFDTRPAVAFCGSVDAPVPAGAKWLRVGATAQAAGTCTTVSGGTTGTVTVEWS